jgi:Zn-dependent protease
MQSLNLIQRIAIYALPLLLALTVREMARGRVAWWLGDRTGAQLGRLSLNPMNHVDPLGTLAIPGLMLAMSSNGLGGFLLGWPKLIPIDYRQLPHPKRDLGLIALAGLMANLLMLVLWALLLKFALDMHAQDGLWLGVAYMAWAGVSLNAGFFVLNLLPIPPCDGGRLLISILPHGPARQLAALERYSFIILIALMVTNLLRYLVMVPLVLLVNVVLVLLSIDPAPILS